MEFGDLFWSKLRISVKLEMTRVFCGVLPAHQRPYLHAHAQVLRHFLVEVPTCCVLPEKVGLSSLGDAGAYLGMCSGLTEAGSLGEAGRQERSPAASSSLPIRQRQHGRHTTLIPNSTHPHFRCGIPTQQGACVKFLIAVFEEIRAGKRAEEK